MMKFLPSILILLSISAAHASDQKIVIEVGTMVCGADPHNIKNSLASIAGVKQVDISLPDKTATITFDDQVSNANAMLVAIAGAGYAGLVKPK
jgi:copper chaperone CopZ